MTQLFLHCVIMHSLGLLHSAFLIVYLKGLFEAAQGILVGEGGEAKCSPPPTYMLHISMKPGTVIPYLKEIQKIYKSRDTPHEFC